MYESYFPPENIKVMLFEQFIGSQTYISDLFAFLGVPPFVPSTFHTRVNQGNKRDTSRSVELQQYLVDYFTQPNARLAEHLRLSLAEWQR